MKVKVCKLRLNSKDAFCEKMLWSNDTNIKICKDIKYDCNFKIEVDIEQENSTGYFRCPTCFNGIKNACYGYDQGNDCYESIFKKYKELENKIKGDIN